MAGPTSNYHHQYMSPGSRIAALLRWWAWDYHIGLCRIKSLIVVTTVLQTMVTPHVKGVGLPEPRSPVYFSLSGCRSMSSLYSYVGTLQILMSVVS